MVFVLSGSRLDTDGVNVDSDSILLLLNKTSSVLADIMFWVTLAAACKLGADDKLSMLYSDIFPAVKYYQKYGKNLCCNTQYRKVVTALIV